MCLTNSMIGCSMVQKMSSSHQQLRKQTLFFAEQLGIERLRGVTAARGCEASFAWAGTVNDVTPRPTHRRRGASSPHSQLPDFK